MSARKGHSGDYRSTSIILSSLVIKILKVWIVLSRIPYHMSSQNLNVVILSLTSPQDFEVDLIRIDFIILAWRAYVPHITLCSLKSNMVV